MNKIKTWQERIDPTDPHYKVYGDRYYMAAEIAELRAALAATQNATQPAAVGVPSLGMDYGGTDFGFTFAGPTLEEGDKRLAALLVRALGTDHPAIDDFVSLTFRARATSTQQPVAQGVELPDEPKRGGPFNWHKADYGTCTCGNHAKLVKHNNEMTCASCLDAEYLAAWINYGRTLRAALTKDKK